MTGFDYCVITASPEVFFTLFPTQQFPNNYTLYLITKYLHCILILNVVEHLQNKGNVCFWPLVFAFVLKVQVL